MRIWNLVFLVFGLLLIFSPAFSQAAGTLIVLSKSENKAEFISLQNWQKVGEVPTGIAPHEVAVSPNGEIAVVTNYGHRQPGHSLTVIHIPEKRVLRTIDLGTFTRPHGIVFLKKNTVLVTAEGKQAVLTVDIATGTIKQVVHTGQKVSHMVVVSGDGKTAYVANIGSNSISVIDLVKGKLQQTLPALEGPEGIALEPHRSHIWFANRGANTIIVYDIQHQRGIDTLHTADFPIRITMAPHVPLALVSCAKAGVVEIWNYQNRQRVARIDMEVKAAPDVETRLFRDRFGKSPVPIGVVVSGTQPLAFVANSNADVVAVIDLSALKVVRYLPTAKQPDGMAWTSYSFK